MTTINWPATVPFIENPEAYRESGPSGNVIRSEMDGGPAKTRRRFTSAVRQVSGETSIMTDAQVSAFETWFRDEIADGALSFRAVNPRTGVLLRYRFVDDYEIIHLIDGKHRISMKLENLP